MIKLGDPGPVMDVTEDLRVLLGDPFLAGDQKASAASAILLQVPAVRAVKSVLTQHGGKAEG